MNTAALPHRRHEVQIGAGGRGRRWSLGGGNNKTGTQDSQNRK